MKSIAKMLSLFFILKMIIKTEIDDLKILYFRPIC